MRLSKGDDIRKKREKQVRFANNVAVRHMEQCCNNTTSHDRTSCSRNGTWWSPDEMTEIRHAAKVSSREVSRNVWMLDAFEEAHRIARQLAASQDDAAALMEILENPASHISQELTSWCRYGHCRRGLERWSSKFHNVARTEAVKRARRKVLDEMKESDPESIRLVYERLTRSSRIFARFMGHADEAATEPVVAERMKSSNNCEQSSSVSSSPAHSTPALEVKISCRLRINRQ
jgi:uncharacterized protein (DUF1778 family)